MGDAEHWDEDGPVAVWIDDCGRCFVTADEYATALEERDHARARWDEHKRLAEATAIDLNEAEAEIARLRHRLRGQ